MALNLHSAPAVVYPLGRSRLEAAMLALAWLAGALLLVRWLAAGLAPGDWRFAAVCLALAAAGVSAWFGWTRQTGGVLAWDGREWRRDGAGPELHLKVVADFQRALLLELRAGAHATRWFWVDAAAMPERWPDLRRAVHARRPAASAVAVSAHADADPKALKP